MPVTLTPAKIRSLKPRATEYVQGDLLVPGFGVRVRANGTKSYIIAKRLPGQKKPTKVTLEWFDPDRLAEARDWARHAAASIKAGKHPSWEMRSAAKDQRLAHDRVSPTEPEMGFAAGTFGSVAIRYIAVECSALKRGHEIEAIIRRALLPAWGERLLDTLHRKDLTTLLDPIVASGRTQAAHKLREIAIRITNFALERGEAEANRLMSPSRGRKRIGGLRRSTRSHILADDELSALWIACEAVGRPFGTIVRVLMLTGQRRDEVAGMEWAEIELEKRLWIIPARRYKTGIDHYVPLPKAAINLLRQVERRDDVFVFSTRSGTRFRGYSKAKAALDQHLEIAEWRLHDIRRTVRTGLSALGTPPDTAERVLGHAIGGVRGIYDRHLFLDEKRAALENWASHVERIVSSKTQHKVGKRPRLPLKTKPRVADG